MVSDRTLLFHIYIPWDKTLSFEPKSRSSVKVKVKYQGHSFRKKNHGLRRGISVSQTQLVPSMFSKSSLWWLLKVRNLGMCCRGLKTR